MNRRLLKILAAVGALFGGAAALFALVVSVWIWRWPPSFPNVPYPDVQASTDPDVIAAGEYLFHAVAHCTICHTKEEDFLFEKSVWGMPATGHHHWVMGPMGEITSSNITIVAPTYSDAELARLITTGIGKDHHPIPLMAAIGAMHDDDVTALVSYVRTLREQGKDAPPTELTSVGIVMLKVLLPGFVLPKQLDAPPYVAAGGISVERGRYLAEGPAFCIGCHNEVFLAPQLAYGEPYMAGGTQVNPDPYDETMEMVSPNLTRGGLLATLSEDGFVARLSAGRAHEGSPMPWENYGHLTDEDKRSLYRYLASLPASDRDMGPSYRKVGWSPE